MTDFIHALEFGFGIVVVALIIWGLAALDEAFPKHITMPKQIKRQFRFLVISQKTKNLIFGISAWVLGIVVAGGIFALVLSAIFLPGSGTSHVAQPPPPHFGFDRFEEWNAAKRFIQAQYPGAQTFSDSDESTVQADTDGTCVVVIAVGGVNGFNAPIRDKLTVIMKYQDGRFGLQRIDSQNEQALVQQQIKDGY